ncbi:MAG TPA: GTPase domain-containing protein [Herpetosiphonaceae bacterium]
MRLAAPRWWRHLHPPLIVVYHGPACSGKTASLQTLAARMSFVEPPGIMSAATPAARQLSLTFGVPQIQRRVTVKMIAGAAMNEECRAELLAEADGVIVVADSQQVKLGENARSMKLLGQVFKARQIRLRTAPLVLQYNKRDVPGRLELDELNRALNPGGWPWGASVAARGVGVTEAFDLLIERLIALRGRWP